MMRRAALVGANRGRMEGFGAASLAEPAAACGPGRPAAAAPVLDGWRTAATARRRGAP